MNEWKLYAFGDEACPELSGQIEALKRNGLHGLEIRGVDGENVAEITLEKARDVKRRLDDAGLTVWSVGSPIGKIDMEKDDFAAHAELFRHVLDVARALDAPNIRMFSFYIPQDKDPEDYREEVIERLGKLCDLAAGSGVNLCHENEKHIYGENAPRCAALHRALPALKAVFDPANFIQSGQATWPAWELLSDYVHYMHIKDALADGQVVPAGMGAGEVERIARAYMEKGGNAFSIEPHLFNFVGLAALEREAAGRQVGGLRFADAYASFDAACDAFKALLERR